MDVFLKEEGSGDSAAGVVSSLFEPLDSPPFPFSTSEFVSFSLLVSLLSCCLSNGAMRTVEIKRRANKNMDVNLKDVMVISVSAILFDLQFKKWSSDYGVLVVRLRK